MMLAKHFKEALPIIETIEANGYQAFFVGGAVRDFILGLSISDIDIATSATPEVMQRIFDKVIPVGIEHGTVIVRHAHQSYEVTTFRSDGNYSDHRHPDQVTFISDLKEDLSRRDFTMNAIAMDRFGVLHDPFNGQNDIKNKQIQTVGNPAARFLEDPLRMMRALRFVSQLDFSIENTTYQAIHHQIPLIETLAVERLAIELEKMFAGSQYMQALALSTQVDLWRHLPVFQDLPSIGHVVKKMSCPLHHLFELSAFISCTYQDITIKEMAKKWKLSNHSLNKAKVLIDLARLFNQQGLTTWLVYQLPSDLYKSFVRLIRNLTNQEITVDQLSVLANQLPLKSRKEMQVNGEDIVAMYPNRSKGAWLGTYLNEVEYAIVQRDVENDYQQIKEWLTKWHPPEIE
ncbi:CCA-adding enzyme [Paraliobacillus ryukyuensis]|uniref:CCA-adding enzyme n=1 Tax=Paraliobacillus ryukyuensis TaxID=200904 RepID=A0A366EGI6_9BACI|nr:CCA tRNA nucleotidyltransferase [Paraliobacillus ryukyuensis]RBP01551.1 tRNA nucleotidyltransferase (CCA-adding enzyme) [Paraliobacillus ryukyuensis]